MEKRKFIKRSLAFLTLSALLMTTALAAGGTVSFNQAGFIFHETQVVEAGQDMTAPNGQKIPGIITYTDESGGKTNYISINKLAELLDTPIEWDAEKNSVILAGNPYIKNPNNGPDSTVIPEYGKTIGPFTEIDPSQITMSPEDARTPDILHLSSSKGGILPQRLSFVPGTVHVLEVTNNGKEQQKMGAFRYAPGSIYAESFTPVVIEPGQTITRAFYMDT